MIARQPPPAIVAAIAQLMSSLGGAGFAGRLLGLAEAALVHDAAALMLFHDKAPPAVLVDHLKAAERGYLYGDYLSGVYLLSPFYRLAAGLSGPRVARVTDIAPQGFSASEYYRRYFSHIGVADMIGVLLPGGGRSTVFMSLSRSTDRPRFWPSDKARLETLLPIFAAAIDRHVALAGPLARTAPARAQPKASAPATPLTAREAEVVNLILEGYSTRALAARLGISTETVRVHRRHIYAKLEVTSQAELFRWFLASRRA